MSPGSSRALLLGLLILANTSPALAEQDRPDQDAPADEEVCETPAETVVVTASREEQKLFEACRSIEAMGSAQLDQLQPRSLPEALSEMVGVYLQQTNRGAGAPFLRGLVGPQNLILVDGVRFNTATYRTGPNQYLALIDANALSQVEVVRGPSSVLYGNGAMGGVFHALTLTASDLIKEGRRGRVQLRLATADTSQGASFSVRPLDGDFQLLVGASLDSFGTLRAGEGTKQANSDYTTAYWHAKLAWTPESVWRLSGAYLGARIDGAGRMDKAGNGDLRFYDNSDHLVYLRVDRQPVDFLKKARATLSYQRLNDWVDRYSCIRDADGTVNDLGACFDLASGQLTRKRRYTDTVDVIGFDLMAQFTIWPERLQLTSGAEIYREWIASSLQSAQPDSGWAFETQTRGNFSDGSTHMSLGAFVHLDLIVWDFGPKLGSLRLTGGARVSHFAAEAPNVPGLGDVSFEHTGAVGSAGLQWLTPGLLNLYLSFVQGFRAPNLQETTNMGDTGQKFSVPNDQLGPERSNTIEVGGRLNWGPVSAQAAYFYAINEDALTWQAASWQGQSEIEGKPVSRMTNAVESLHQGIEMQLELSFWRLTAAGGLTWMQGDEKELDGVKHPARWIPPLFGQVSLRYDHPDRRLLAQVIVRAAGRQDRLHPLALLDSRICQTAPYSGLIREPCQGVPGWVAVDLRTAWRPHQDLMLHLNLANLSDEHYRAHGSGFDMPGFDVRIGLTARF